MNQDGLDEVPQLMEKATSATLLTMNGNNLTSFDVLCNMEALVHLYLNANKIGQFILYYSWRKSQ
jgi:hypothetical protein